MSTVFFADPRSTGDCKHLNPMWGMCSQCKRLDNFNWKYIPNREYKIKETIRGRIYELLPNKNKNEN